MLNILTIIGLSLLLNGCAFFAVGAVAGTTAVVATDPRDSGTVINDNTIATKLKARIAEDYSDMNIYVNCYDGVVLITGQVDNLKIKQNIEFEARTIVGVKEIYNYLEIGASQSFASNTVDSYTTTQIKTKLISLDNVHSNDIKIVTTNSVVYLLGIVTHSQAQEISKAAASINGVNKVITLFKFIN